MIIKQQLCELNKRLIERDKSPNENYLDKDSKISAIKYVKLLHQKNRTKNRTITKKRPPGFHRGVTLLFIYKSLCLGAGGGNRTRVSSLEG